MSREFGRHPWEAVRVRLICRLLDGIACDLSSDALLDVGCGDAYVEGVLLQRYQQLQIYAIDYALDEQHCLELKGEQKDGRLEVYTSLEKISAVNTVGVVTLLDVLEHIKKEDEFLREIQALPCLKNEAWVIMTVPAFQFLYGRHDRSLDHHRRYDRKYLRNVLEQNGFEVVEMGYFFFSLLFVRCIELIWEKATNPTAPSQGVAAWKAHKLRDKIIRAFLRFDCAVGFWLRKIGISLPGTSLYCVARIRKKSIE